MTAEELFALGDDKRRDLINGVLHELPFSSGDHGKAAAFAIVALGDYVRQHGGTGFGPGTGFVLARDPDTVRAPDVAYLSPERAAEVGSTLWFIPGPPDLAVEVVDHGDAYSEVTEKTLGWIDADCTVVLVVDPKARRITRYRRNGGAVFAGDQAIDCSPAMPGFSPTASQLLGER